MTPTPQEWGQFGYDAAAWARVLLRLKAAAADGTDVTLTGDEAALVISFTRMLAQGTKR